ncbi:MFS transporter [Klebsiella pneumoniae]|uniref:MFS transporter n=1 Tax=Klebsiella pneumoniae TaxID=573 RepID=A0A927DTL3_KLEPN|nr:MFS transporter [Klebsiella pneumoniae]
MVSASGQLFFGPLSDRIGRLKPLALSLLLFIFSSAMCALTRDINMLIVWRFYKALPAPAARCCRDPSPAINTGGTLLTQFFALLMTVNGIAPVLSPVLGGYVITAFDWRILFWTMAAIGGVLLVMSPAILRETRPATAAHASRQRPGQPVLKNRRFLRFCLIQGLYDGRAVLLHRLFFLRDAERIRHERHAVQSAVRSERYRADHRRDDLFPSGAPL